MENVDLVFEDAALRAVAKKALERNTGARGLRSILENALLETMYDLPSRTDVGTVVVTEAVIEEGAKPEFQHRTSASKQKNLQQKKLSFKSIPDSKTA